MRRTVFAIKNKNVAIDYYHLFYEAAGTGPIKVREAVRACI
jgi:hypothetical protein